MKASELVKEDCKGLDLNQCFRKIEAKLKVSFDILATALCVESLFSCHLVICMLNVGCCHIGSS
jgi:hypothetical protein